MSFCFARTHTHAHTGTKKTDADDPDGMKKIFNKGVCSTA